LRYFGVFHAPRGAHWRPIHSPLLGTAARATDARAYTLLQYSSYTVMAPPGSHAPTCGRSLVGLHGVVHSLRRRLAWFWLRASIIPVYHKQLADGLKARTARGWLAAYCPPFTMHTHNPQESTFPNTLYIQRVCVGWAVWRVADRLRSRRPPSLAAQFTYVSRSAGWDKCGRGTPVPLMAPVPRFLFA